MVKPDSRGRPITMHQTRNIRTVSNKRNTSEKAMGLRHAILNELPSEHIEFGRQGSPRSFGPTAHLGICRSLEDQSFTHALNQQTMMATVWLMMFYVYDDSKYGHMFSGQSMNSVGIGGVILPKSWLNHPTPSASKILIDSCQESCCPFCSWGSRRTNLDQQIEVIFDS